MSLQQEILEELQCQICTNYIFPPIGECLSGHGFCMKCTKKLHNCPQCRAPLIYQKNTTLEALHAMLEIPCENSENGCKFAARATELKIHQSQCTFKSKEQLDGENWWQLNRPIAFFLIFLILEIYFIASHNTIVEDKDGEIIILSRH